MSLGQAPLVLPPQPRTGRPAPTPSPSSVGNSWPAPAQLPAPPGLQPPCPRVLANLLKRSPANTEAFVFLQPLRRLRREHQGRLRTPLAASVPAPRPRTPRPSNRARTRPDSAVLALCHCPLTAKRTSAPGGRATATASGLTESGPAQAPARSRGPRVWVAPLLVPWSDAGIKALPGGQWTQLVWTGGAEDNVGSASGLPGKGLSSEPCRTRPGCRVRVPSGVLQGMGVRGPPLAPPPRPLCSALPGFITFGAGPDSSRWPPDPLGPAA